ncbi:DUF3318 domain-containing protein [Cupriavidus plantarum]|uniref:Uncharacterized protein DUF3318 n=1 Tax=Cupriavidus plantarum TaxID=942865 RepID=A0A316F162_9BURK|nr:DUF3318 domain-containing protein [Cupriavidus plantarum]PWK38236.1 uncharacterized protein DUF3318 [Cupriavidus plantarum]
MKHYNDPSNDEQTGRDHPRPARFSHEVRLPLAVRKELLLTRAALERYDAMQALQQVRGGARRMTNLSAWLPKMAGMTRPGGWLKLFGITRDYPMVSTAITLALPLLRKTSIGRVVWKVSKLGAMAGAGYFAYRSWQAAKQPVRKPGDTGFRDPLVYSPPAPITPVATTDATSPIVPPPV